MRRSCGPARPRPLAAATDVTDEQLARQAAAGHVEAFDALYLRYSDWLTGYASRIVGDRMVGREIARNTLLDAFTALRRGATPPHVQLWVSRIALTAALAARDARCRPAA